MRQNDATNQIDKALIAIELRSILGGVFHLIELIILIVILIRIW